ncbi:hypothetical protein COLO4_36762 [Corchorus olitorius]|uniref:Uncharacterized protein n=1 Tax=Corchorus olitorius TaxID=93759 RepID=A0A1R3G5K1_9ROSI|nr:hypothetical protein COLO4_36762 [Corchorus olitorius]
MATNLNFNINMGAVRMVSVDDFKGNFHPSK